VSRVTTGLYGGQSAAQRKAERKAQLLAAGLDLIGTEGWSATTVRGVCTRAGLTSRFFYESFKNLEDLAVAVFDQVIEETTAQVLEALSAAPEDPREKARAAIAAFVRTLTDDPRKARVVFVEALGNDALLARRQATMSAFAQLIAAEGRASYAPSASGSSFFNLTARMLVGGLAELMITWLNGDIEMDRDELTEDCVSLFVTTAESAVAIARKRGGSGPRNRP